MAEVELEVVGPLQEPDNQEKEAQENMGKAMAASFTILFLVFLCFNLAFIIPSLIYAYEGSSCVTTSVDGFSFTLKTWLEIDAYLRIAMLLLLLLVAIGFCRSVQLGVKLMMFTVCTMLIYSLFSLAWTIAGSVLFWGKLNPGGFCEGGVRSYMYAVLIITYVSTCCNCLYNSKLGKSQKEQE